MSYRITDDCIGCTLCAKNCPVHAISGNVKERHQVNAKRCVECGVCGNVCPKAAIVNAQGNRLEKLPKSQWRKPVIDKDACSACSMCVDICGFSCLAIIYPAYTGDLKVYAELKDKKKCVGCGLCAQACPLRIITMKEEE